MDYIDLRVYNILPTTVLDYDRVKVFTAVLSSYEGVAEKDISILEKSYRVYIGRPYKVSKYYENFKQLIIQKIGDNWHDFILRYTRFYYTNDFMLRHNMVDAVKNDDVGFITLGEPKNNIHTIIISE